MKQFIKMSAALVLISAFCAGVLGYTYQKTLKPIKETRAQAQLNAIKDVLDVDFDNDPYAEKIKLKTNNKLEILDLYPAKKNGNLVGIAIKTFSAKGFGGNIELIVGFYMDGRINKFKLVSHKETPGLGTKVEGKKFMNQLNGINPRYTVLKVSQDGGEIDAVTAATVSSRAVLDAVNKAYDSYQKYKENY